MLKVSIHAGPIDSATRFNLLGWVDIGYEKLAPVADYKTYLFQTGVGATIPALIYSYPRWSASLWDLAARAIALSLRTEVECLNEEVPPVRREGKAFAFANQLSAVIEHVSSNSQRRKTLASVDIEQTGRIRGRYIARFTEHTMGLHVTEPFEFRPSFLQPEELLLHACLMRLTSKQELPPRPALCLPDAVEKDGYRYVPIHRLVEPARTGFLQWLNAKRVPPVAHADAKLGLGLEVLYLKFLTEAI